MSASTSTSTSTPKQKAEAFLAWFKENGGTWSSQVKLHHNEQFGYHAVANRDIPLPASGSSSTAQVNALLACPFDLAITPTSCRRYVRVSQNLPASTEKVRLNERQWTVSYLTLHLIGMEDPDAVASLPRLPHLPYTRILPTPSELCTPFFYTPEEKELIKGTEMEKMMINWEGLWREEWETARREVCQGRFAGLRGAFTWSRWLLCNGHLASRAFPSSLLDLPEVTMSMNSKRSVGYPFMVPGLDILNHRSDESGNISYRPMRSGSTSSKKQGKGKGKAKAKAPQQGQAGQVVPAGEVEKHELAFTLKKAIKSGEQVFMDYVSRTNGEFLLGYGVTFPDNPDDLASTGMKIEGGSLPAAEQAELAATGLSIDETFWIALDEDVPDDLFRLIRILMGCKDHQRMSIDQLVAASQVPTSSDSMRFEACVWAAAKETKAMLVLTKLLASNAQSAFKRKKKNEQAVVGPQIRARVKEQNSHYLKGQWKILDRLYNIALTDLEDAFQKVRAARLDPDAVSDDDSDEHGDADEDDWEDASDEGGDEPVMSKEDEDEVALGYDMFTDSVVIC